MGVEGCTRFIKYLLFFFNFIFWLLGGGILGLGLWLRHDEKISNLMNLELDGKYPPHSFYTYVHVMIAVGAVIMVVGFLGCYGAIQESQCLLGTFFVCLVILFACEIAAGIWGYMNRETLATEMKNFYDTVYDQALKENIADQNKKSVVAGVLKGFHETLQCCGKDTVTGVFSVLTSKLGFQDVCSSNFIGVNCHSKIDELFSDKIYLLGIFALVVAVVMIFEMIFSMVLCCGIRNSPVY